MEYQLDLVSLLVGVVITLAIQYIFTESNDGE